jgi:hypothetical protein
MTYFFLPAGGGVHGKVVGTAPATMIGDGHTTEECHLFIDMFLPVGETTTGIMNGKDIGGNIKGCRIENCKETGVDGKEPGTGKRKTPGEFVS